MLVKVDIPINTKKLKESKGLKYPCKIDLVTMENYQFQWVNHGKSTINGNFQ